MITVPVMIPVFLRLQSYSYEKKHALSKRNYAGFRPSSVKIHELID